jgi:heme/copper-type cytochrome/quinol oxidase subunit 2
VIPILVGLLLTVPLLAAAIVGICLLDAMEFCGRAENEWSMSILWIFLIEVLIMESIVALLFTFVSCCRKVGKRRRAKKAAKRQSREMARA